MVAGGGAGAGHVSMMNDVLISQLPPDLLRATLRTLLGATHTNPSLFASTIRAHLPVLSPSSFHLVLSGPDAVRDIDDLLVQARIRFASHLIAPALAILSYLLQTIIQQQIRLSAPAAVYDKLVEAGGDMVQSAQALKESGDRSDPARTSLLAIIEELRRYRQFWLKTNSGSNLVPSPFPLDRAIYQYIDTAKIVFPDDSVVMELEPPEYTTIHSPGACKNPLPVVKLGSIVVPRLFFGLWQLSSPAWGSASEEQIIAGLREMVSNGLVAADMADHYADAELLFGRFRNHIFPGQREPIICATKYCQFLRVPANEVIHREWVMRRVKERTDRVGGTVELLQVHWQYLDDKRYLDVFNHLIEITKTNPELIRAVGLCNFDAAMTERICAHLVKIRGEVGIVSNQVQYSLIDQRPRFAISEVCRKYGIKLLTYGTFCGGFLADRWVGKAEPDIYAGGLNTSQRKYFDMIKAWGGWGLFQELLNVLHEIAVRRGVDVSNVAARWVLERPETGVVIVGSRLGVTSHIPSTIRTLTFDYHEQDATEIEAVVAKSRVREMFEQIGDCGSEYR